MAIELILGTAGHIDHGKTSLVRALTGVDTDRLPEEKLRGITIELGFAQLDLGECRLGIVDVPGHERFVRNMLAGATGVDLALLVVAANDSVKPQTREHLEILRLLEVETGVIALTKCDLPTPEWIDLVEEEVRELTRDTFLAKAPIVRTSATTGAGLDDLRRELASAARAAAQSPRGSRLQAPFRLAIDRAFTIAGHGTVVTGSVASGRVRVGDELKIEPGDISVRVRGTQNHDQPAEEVHRGQRAAINLAGIHHDQIQRGQELCAPGHLVPSKRLTVRLRLLDSLEKPLKNRTRARCHVGTAELMSSVVLLEGDRLAPGETGFAQVLLSEPAVTTWGQPFVLRAESPVYTLGGGQVLDPQAPRLTRGDPDDLARLTDLTSADPVTRASGALYFAGARGWRPEELARVAGIVDHEAALAGLIARGDVRELELPNARKARVHARFLERVFDRVSAALAKEHDAAPLRTSFDRSPLKRRFDHLGSEAWLDAALEQMRKSGRLLVFEHGVAVPGRGPKISQNERKLLEQLLETYLQAGWQAPTVDEIKARVAKNLASVEPLLKLAASDGQLVEIDAGLYMHAQRERELRELLASRFDGAGVTVSQIREWIGVSRKFAVPILEYLDRMGFTRREGDLRFLAAPSKKS